MSSTEWIAIVLGAILLLVLIAVLVHWVERRMLRNIELFVSQRNTNELINLARNQTFPKVQIRAVEALAELQDPASIPTLVALWLDAGLTPEVREAFENTLVKMPGEHVVPVLLARVQGEDKAWAQIGSGLLNQPLMLEKVASELFRNGRVLELMRKFDLPEAKAVVQAADQQRAQLFARLTGQRQVPSLAEALTASLMNIHRESQQNFSKLLREVAPALSDPLSIRDSVAPTSNITWDNSEDLREASQQARNPSTHAEGITKLKALCEHHPSSSAPYALLAQAMEQDHRCPEAEQLLLNALNKVHARSEILDMLGSIAKGNGDFLKATAYYLVAAYAMNPNSTDWGTIIYLSGVYRALGNESRANDCKDAAAAMRGGNPVQLTAEMYAAIEQAVEHNSILSDLANSAWPSLCDNIARLSDKLEKDSWTPGPPPKPAATAEKEAVKAMLSGFEDKLDLLLRTAAPFHLSETASMKEKLSAAAVVAQSDNDFKDKLLAVLDGVKSQAESISTALEEAKSEKVDIEAGGEEPTLKDSSATSAEQPFARRKLEVSWEDFVAQKMLHPAAGSSELCLRCQFKAMAESILKLRPADTNRFLREQPLLAEFTDGTAASVFELEGANDTDVFVDELFSANYGDEKPIVINGIVVGSLNTKATIDKLGVPQAMSMGDVVTW